MSQEYLHHTYRAINICTTRKQRTLIFQVYRGHTILPQPNARKSGQRLLEKDTLSKARSQSVYLAYKLTPGRPVLAVPSILRTKSERREAFPHKRIGEATRGWF